MILASIFNIILHITSTKTSNPVQDETLEFAKFRQILEWSDCYMLQEDHPWKGLKVKKRSHPFLLDNRTKSLINERDYQLKLCDCADSINHYIYGVYRSEHQIEYKFSQMVIMDRIEFQTKSWKETNMTELRVSLEANFGSSVYDLGNFNKTIRKDDEIVKWGLHNRPHLINANLTFDGDGRNQTGVFDVNFYGCSLACGGVKMEVTGVIHHAQFHMEVPGNCLWYVEPAKSSSIVFNVLEASLDCDASDVVIADGSKPFMDMRYTVVASLCKNSVSNIESLLYSSVWVYYISSPASKKVVEQFSAIYYGGCDLQYLINEPTGYINVSIHGALDVQMMKFDCSIYIRRVDKKPFFISFRHFYLFSLTKSACTSNYVMIYSGNTEINNIPFCDSITPPKFIDARYGWLRLKIINSAPIYDLSLVIFHKLLTENDSVLFGTEESVIADKQDEKATIIVFYCFIACVSFIGFAVLFHGKLRRLKIYCFDSKIVNPTTDDVRLLETNRDI